MNKKGEKLLFHPLSLIPPPFSFIPPPSSLLFEPSLEGGQDVLLLFGQKGAAFGNTVPFLKAAATAGRRSVLRYESGMMPHGRLLPVVEGMGRGQSLLYKVGGVLEDDAEPSLLEVFKLFAAQAKAPAERRAVEGCKDFV
jgi:hypothetical protein